ncbi:MAG: Nex18 symbiotically induced protein, partial [Bacteroidetes bacterium QH_2_63_10]
MYNILYRATLIATAALLLAVGPVAAQQDDMTNEQPNMVETAVQADGFDTLIQALKAADLAEALQGEGPFTVFAPTDEAFAALPDGKLES